MILFFWAHADDFEVVEDDKNNTKFVRDDLNRLASCLPASGAGPAGSGYEANFFFFLEIENLTKCVHFENRWCENPNLWKKVFLFFLIQNGRHFELSHGSRFTLNEEKLIAKIGSFKLLFH